MSQIKVFFCEPTGDILHTQTFGCPDDHETKVEHGRIKAADEPSWENGVMPCPDCGKKASIQGSVTKAIYRRTDTGEELGDGFPVGAVWEAGWREGPDGRRLTVMTPDGAWFIDGRASNCTMPTDNEHRCWVRHGAPEDGTLHVDKNGHTCQAGGGSIMMKQYHGFLHQGRLTKC